MMLFASGGHAGRPLSCIVWNAYLIIPPPKFRKAITHFSVMGVCMRDSLTRPILKLNTAASVTVALRQVAIILSSGCAKYLKASMLSATSLFTVLDLVTTLIYLT